MSTIKSSDEHLTLNADGSSKDIKFQANGVEKASISSSGAFTSTTIDATKLTGNLPAINGAALTGVGVSGISSSAGATAMTIDANEVITITQPNSGLDTSFVVSEVNGNNPELLLKSNRDNSSNYRGANIMSFGRGVGDTTADVRSASISMLGLQGSSTGKIKGKMSFTLADDDTSASETVLELFHNRRVVSQSNAHAWLTMNGTGTISISDSYNVSSIADNGTGFYDMNFDVDMANANYAAVGNSGQYAGSINPYAKYTATYAFKSFDDNAAAADDANIMIIAFGDTA